MEWICMNCHKVFRGKNPKCCGECVKFSPRLHGALLVSTSNAWIQVWEAWKDHPKLKEASDRLINDFRSFGAAGHINEFIETLIRGQND